ncbi:MAG: hypothetical protein M1383_06315 [Patescibacteria group bacterium]|nr:hypothetical protein [Patescibacteria group bacterium]
MTHCHVCHLTVAPFDPERVQKGIHVYHRPCLRKQDQKEEDERRQRERLLLSKKIRVLKADHDAYNRLFANAASLDQCIQILKRDWWPQCQ